MADLIEISGSVIKLNCQKPTFCAGRIAVPGKGSVSFSVKGSCREGDAVTLKGVWEDHPQYGEQFRAKSLTLSLPTDRDGLIKWLGWNVRRVGSRNATNLVDEFGTDLMSRAASDPEAVAIFIKLPIEIIEEMVETWAKEGDRVGALTWLAGLGLTQKQCEAILSKWGGGAPSQLKDDPYQLIGAVDGFGWTTTDELAALLNITGDDPRRLKGAVAAVVREAQDDGSTCILIADAVKQAADKLDVRDPQIIADVVAGCVERGDVIKFGRVPQEYLTTQYAYHCERTTFSFLTKNSRCHNPHVTANPEDVAEEYRSSGGITLDDEQVSAIATALRHRVSVICGGAGSGKTSLSCAIVKAFGDADVPVYLASPTGKAARRMAEVIGHPASTIHRLLEYNGGTGQFTRGPNDPLNNCVVLVDEASMIDANLFYHLVSAMGNRCALVLVGDPNQLPPVSAGSLLRDIIAHDLAPVVTLKTVHRQAGHLKLNSMRILEGFVEPSVTDYEGKFSPWMVHNGVTSEEVFVRIVRELWKTHLPKWGFDPMTDAQFMTAKHDGPYGTRRVNSMLQALAQDALGVKIEPNTSDDERAVIRVGDKVIQTKNNYDLNVMNGETGTVMGIDVTRPKLLKMLAKPNPGGFADLAAPTEAGSAVALNRARNDEQPIADYVVRFSDRVVVFPTGQGGALELAYCLTTHKCQGSQYHLSITICVNSHRHCQNRSWLYTSVTRAQRSSIVLGDVDGMRRAVEKVVVDRRITITQVLATQELSPPNER